MIRYVVVVILLTICSSTRAQPFSQIEVCFVLDTTGSMASLIETAKQKIWFVANTIVSTASKPTVRYCLMGYRDRGDAYVTRHVDLSHDLDQIYQELMAFKAEGGGDYPEAVNQALLETVENSAWSSSSDVLKLIFLLGDAPPHDDYDEPGYPAISRLAKQRGIVINPILCGNHAGTRTTWQQIAQLADGMTAEIGNGESKKVPPTPIDQDLVALNARLGTMIIPYGNPAQRQQVIDKQARAEAMADAVVVDRLAYNTSTRKIVQGDGDLIADLDTGKVRREQIRPDMLPTELRSMSQSELTEYLENFRQKRASISGLVASLIDQRNQLINQLLTADQTSFEITIAKMIEHQLTQPQPNLMSH